MKIKRPSYRVPITSRKTGVTKMSNEMFRKDDSPSKPLDSVVADLGIDVSKVDDTADLTERFTVPAEVQEPEAVEAPSAQKSEDLVELSCGESSVARPPVALIDSGADEDGVKRASFSAMEEFLEYAYSRRGQSLSVKSRMLERLAHDPELADQARLRLLGKAKADLNYSVARRILLALPEFHEHQRVARVLIDFVESLMIDGEIFIESGVRDYVIDSAESRSIDHCIRSMMRANPIISQPVKNKKNMDIDQYRKGAVRLFVCWLGMVRHHSPENLVLILQESLWMEPAERLLSDAEKVAAITEVEELAAVGFACQRFRAQLRDANRTREAALQQLLELRDALNNLSQVRDELQAKLNEVENSARAVRFQLETEVGQIKEIHGVESTNLKHQIQTIVGRATKQLESAVSELSVGLSAIRKEPPRTAVMVERAELVREILTLELANLKAE